MTNDIAEKPDPWRVPVALAQIPDTGLHRDIEADNAVRAAIAQVGELREVLSASASFDVIPKSGGRFQVTGGVQARVGQTCVVTLDPIENEIEASIDLLFAPPEQIPDMADLVDDAEESETETPDPPEPILNDVIDLGRLATDALLLEIDPHPRKPGAVFEPLVAVADPEDHPFAALKVLKVDAKPESSKSPRGNKTGES